MPRQVFYKDEDASFEYEVSGLEVLVHCDVNKWNKVIKHQLAVDSYNFFSKQDKPIIAVHDKEDKKHFKFITMMGFYPCLDEILIEDGSKNMMFIWSNI